PNDATGVILVLGDPDLVDIEVPVRVLLHPLAHLLPSLCFRYRENGYFLMMFIVCSTQTHFQRLRGSALPPPFGQGTVLIQDHASARVIPFPPYQLTGKLDEVRQRGHAGLLY